jgi:two-component system sensor histidine kinase UhpB
VLVVDREIDRELPVLSEEAELVVYRVAQEALTNVARHAGTEQAELSLKSDGRVVTLRVRDRGLGIAAGAADGGGIRGMRERAVLVGADLTVARRREGGTEVRLDVPLAGNE